MPCVLPVLSLKLLSLAGKAGARRGEVVTGAVATTAGILFSFWALALAAVAARATGLVVGWGVQFQEPGFVAFLTVVVVLFCLNLWGVFEINLPQRLAGIASKAPHEGITGHFATGLFATLMATPCTAPALGTAVSFALSQDAVTVFAMFSAVGVGMALPYLVLAVLPRSTRWLPRPGQWMVNLRVTLGFLLAASAVWLLYVLSGQISAERLVVFQLVLLMMALLLWACHRFKRTGLRGASGLGALATMVLAIGLVTQAQPQANGRSQLADRLIAWVPFDRQSAEQLARDGELVFVDVTADWCLTCKANEGFVLETEEIAGAFERLRVVPMKADWTNPDASIAQFLMDHGRTGIPFYLLYGPGAEPHVFGELLTKRAVLDALERAQRATAVRDGGVPELAVGSALVDDFAVQDR
jgi:suppressor for copper-sensitivity B